MRQHLRESSIFQPEQYTLVPASEYEKRGVHQKLTEKTQSFDADTLIIEAMRLKENLTSDNDKVLLEKVIKRLRENGTIDNSFKVWKLPIGRYENLNGNKRIYPRKLWENVKARQQDTWKGIAGLMDHPEADDDPGLARDQAIVWHDMDVGDDGIVYGYGTFVGNNGRLAQEIIECGGRCGFSSSGFGDVDKVTKVVDPETYIIERLADIVVNPSQGVYGTADCTHTAADFIKDVHKGATIEFEKQAMREGQSRIAYKNSQGKIIEKENKMADNTQKVDAAQQPAPQAGAPAQPAAPQPAPAPAAPAPAAPAQGGGAPDPQAPAAGQPPAQPQQRSDKLNESLTKVEEKAFRKYVNAFIEDASKIENPIHRLNECTEILGYFESGVCPDLKAKLEEQLIEEKAKLEKLIETSVKVEEDFGVDVSTLRENALKITTQAKILNEQVTDYKELCEELAKRNKKLLEDNKKLYKQLDIASKLKEKTEVTKNKEITTTNSELEGLKEKLTDAVNKNKKLMERVSELSLSNKSFEKENGVLGTKLKEAAQLLLETRDIKDEDGATVQKLNNQIKSLQKKLTEAEQNYASQGERFEHLTEKLASMQKEIDANNPQLHVMPKFEDRVGKFFNLREGKGAEIEEYWEKQVSRYGDNVLPFEKHIRGAKTLREATDAFLKYRTQIDPDFAVAQPINQYAYRNRSERQALMESQGIPIPSIEDATTEQLNEDFARRMAAAGLR
jgi:hypothetical protein